MAMCLFNLTPGTFNYGNHLPMLNNIRENIINDNWLQLSHKRLKMVKDYHRMTLIIIRTNDVLTWIWHLSRRTTLHYYQWFKPLFPTRSSKFQCFNTPAAEFPVNWRNIVHAPLKEYNNIMKFARKSYAETLRIEIN